MNSKKETSASPSTNELKKELAAITSELSRKNRDLEIEASLERVRAVAMGMNQSDDLLSICETMFHELKKLGFDDLRNAMIDIHYEAKAYLLNYDYSDNTGKTITTFKYNSHPIVDNLIYHAKQSSEAFTEMVYSGKALDEWRIFRKQNGEADDPRIENIDALYYYFYSIGTGAVGISTFSAANPEQLNVLKRFRNVFDLAYRRYTDIEKASAQAKEAQIEASLERVRAVAMSMRQSEELINVCETLYKELLGLGFTNIRNAQIAINNDERQTYSAFEYADYGANVKEASYDTHKLLQEIEIEVKRSMEALFQKQITGQELDDWRAWRKQIGLLTDERVMRANAMCFYLYSIGMGMLGISTYDAITTDQLETLKRFKNVCELAYRRYADVAQAEAQAREAQIELGLERVRARAMAMQSSGELADLVTTLFNELAKLDFALSWCMINIIDGPALSNTVWAKNADAGGAPESFHMKFEGYPFHDAMWREWKERNAKYVYTIEGEEKRIYDEYLFNQTEFSRLPETVKAGMRATERYVASFSFSNFGGLQTVGDAPLPDASLDILSRFGKVFDLTYTRFNDLKQAEEQAREAQIELALERVRARTMAMQHSDELVDAAAILFKQVKDLSVEVWTCGFQIWKPDEPGTTVAYMTLPDGTIRVPFDIPHPPEPFLNRAYEAAVRGDQFYVEELGGDALAAHYKYMLALPGSSDRMADISAGGFHLPEFQVNHNAYFSQGSLLFITYKPVPESWDIFKRFAKVFEQTYTRFLDLKKAEAQAREALIEGALERVRSRAMAMHKTNELGDAAELLYKELIGLGIDSLSVCYVLVNEQDKTGAYYGINPVDGKMMSIPMIAPHTETKEMRALWASWLKQEPVCFIALDPEASVVHQTYIGKLMASAFAAKGVALEFTVEGFLFVSPERIHIYSLNFKQGYLFLVGGVPLPAADIDILIRFTKVFELTYTRFLDIKKAEEQAHEGRIELALERVRARTMAMQHSDELSETAYILFRQFMELGEDPDQITIGIMNEAERVIEFWITLHGNQTNLTFKASIDEPTLMYKLFTGWKEQKRSIVIDLSGQELNDYLTYRASLGGTPANNENRETRRVINAAFFSRGFITISAPAPRPIETILVLERFSGVFEGTYTRFLDLKKAEMQARESLVELALERVRARTMAMQHSDELSETAYILFQQFRELGENPDQATIGIINEAEGVIEYWVTIYGNQTNRVFKFPIEEPNVTNKIYKAWKAQEKSLVIDLGGQALYDFSKFRESMGGAGYNPHEKRRVINVAFFSKGLINVQSTVERSEESLRLLERFANVFEGTYTRFLDLKKAEAQAREAQIELALERVRAKTMAMQHSDELLETSQVVFQQLRDLGETADQIGIAVVKEEEGVFDLFATLHGTQMVRVFQPKIDDPFVMGKVYKNWKAHKRSFVVELGGEQLRQYNILRNQLGGQNYYNENAGADDRWIVCCASFSRGILSFSSSKEPTKEAALLLERFAKVFDSTYTRFLDLQKAEAQAREAKIEAALEKVRASAMAMHQSRDINNAVLAVFEELEKLNFDILRCGIGIIDRENQVDDIWTTVKLDGKSSIQVSGNAPMNIHPLLQGTYDAWLNQTDFLYELKGDDLDAYYLAVAGNNFMLPESQSLTDENHDGKQYYYTPTFKTGNLYAFRESPFPDDAKSIMRRFASVLNLTFSRFLDLQRAEAQARESQIQLALERVRARTMAMQRSDELPETANLLFKQVQELGMPAWSAGYCNWADNKKAITFWMSSEGVLQPPFSMPTTEDPSCIHMREAAERGETFYVEEVGGEALVKHYEYMRTLPVVGEVLDSIINAGHPLPSFQIFHLAYFTHGFLLFISYEPVPAAHDIFKRFAAVFEQTYTRFLDLQKAEAQARESQIQLALERIRARTMAMQKSDELAETVSLVFKQLLALGIRTEQIRTCGIVTFKGIEPIGEQWITETNGDIIPQSFMVPYNEAPAYKSIYKGWKDGEKFMVIHLEGKALKEHLGYLAKGTNVPTRDVILPQQAKEIFNHVLFFSQGCLFIITKEALPEYHDVFKRFGAVFQQSYTRFLDLKKAEAQAREGQIQLAMERVRARTMAMQRSDELTEASYLLDSQVRALGISTRGCAFNIYGENESTEWFGTETGTLVYKTPREEAFLRYYEAGQRGESLCIEEFAGDACKAHYEYLCTLPSLGEELKKMHENGWSFPAHQIDHVVYFKFGYLLFITFEPVPEAHDIFKRFAAVFEQTYTRFLDLKHAEEQARDAKIEAALERTRTQSMIMQHSGELDDTLRVFHEQILHLGIDSAFSFLWLPDEEKDRHIFWAAWAENASKTFKSKAIDYPLDRNEPATAQCLVDWKGNDPVVSYRVPPEGVENYFAAWQELIDGVEQLKPEYFQGGLYYVEAFMKYGCFGVMVESQLTEDEEKILGRMAIEFERTYTRFLDLKKAEAQAREAEIELGLERVRARTMAMQKSDELQEIIKVVYEQLVHLSIAVEHAGFIMDYNTRDDMHIWLADKHYAPAEITVPYFDSPHWNGFNEAKEKGLNFFAICSTFEEKNKFYQDLFKLTLEVTDETKEYYFSCPGLAISTVLLENVGLYIENFAGTPYTDDENATLMRFGKVFQQTYTRFLDLQKAEAQAREGQIEAALERVRSRTMSMHNSQDVGDTITTFFDELTRLGFATLRCSIDIMNDTRMMEIWTAKPGENGKAELVIGHLDTGLHPMLGAMHGAWEAHEPDFFYELAGDDQARYLTALNEYAGYPVNYELASMPARQFLNTFFFADGGILAWTAEPLHTEAPLILKRFASVFGQTYRRYLDLQRAEAQTREAQIEMALERVRAVAMSMRKPGELLEISQTIFTQLKALDFADLRNTEIIINSDEKASVLSYYYSDYGVTGIIEVFFNEHPTVKAWANEMRKANDAFAGMVIPEDEIAAWRKYREEIGYLPDPKLDEAKEVYYYSYSIGLGGLSISSFNPINNDQTKILERFRNVFNLSYQRYADIARAEEQAREAVKQASLDRVRAEIASMRTTGDLERITPLIWDELTILRIPFIRCGVFIVDEAAELMHTHLSTPDGKALAAFDLPFDSEGIGQNVLPAWRKKQSAVIHWTAEEFAANTKSQVERGAVEARERFVTEHPDTSLDLHFFPFLQGMLYVGNIETLNDDAKDLVQSLAEAFSTAYARYEDFNKLEAAKQQVDKTLTDLKSAQTQLIQTEKMASLGELTAGIAHEIQNPLNFVNNFSEVNAELIEEMKAEIEKGDLEEIKALALDIEENSKKINQHGKRADGIVKGMLQHSQSGSGVKEPTNINSVADEYMRLAYHGLRAKDKSFNAEMHTHFDPALPKINVIPQDTGRVLLNLFNNAFYAVNKKQKTAGAGYKPEITVVTSSANGQVIISVKDNGIGIPDAIKEKIMQPFFTTKPTGEGTGLGLSLTYDMVVKGHGGSIQVESVEGEGSEFIIKLPIS